MLVYIWSFSEKIEVPLHFQTFLQQIMKNVGFSYWPTVISELSREKKKEENLNLNLKEGGKYFLPKSGRLLFDRKLPIFEFLLTVKQSFCKRKNFNLFLCHFQFCMSKPLKKH